MTPEQLTSGRKALNPFRGSVKLNAYSSEGADVFVPYLIADPETQGASVMVTRDTPATEVGRLLRSSIAALMEQV